MPPLPTHVTPTLAAIHAQRVVNAVKSDQGDSPFIRVSKAHHECARSIWLDFRWANASSEGWSARMLRLFATGVMQEERILDDLQSIGVVVHRVDPKTREQFVVDIAGYIRGHMDGVALGIPEGPKTWHLLECKTANEKNFNAIKTKGIAKAKPDHWMQIQLYMLGAGLERCLYFLLNKNTDEEHVERINFDLEFTERAVARLVSIAESPRPPGRIHDDPAARTNFHCRFCRHLSLCHEGAMARANCRTCISSRPRPGGNWWCDLWAHELTPEAQDVGCSAHLFIPDLVAGEQVDADDVARTVTYRMRSGETWVDGAAP